MGQFVAEWQVGMGRAHTEFGEIRVDANSISTRGLEESASPVKNCHRRKKQE